MIIHLLRRFDLSLEARLEFLTLAVSNAKSHPVSISGKHETAIAFLSELEDQLEVAQVQMELFHTLLPRIDEPGEVGEKIQVLQKRLFNITEVSHRYCISGARMLIYIQALPTLCGTFRTLDDTITYSARIRASR